MANSTLKGAINIHGGNPQFLIEKVIRARIYDSLYWKEHCFALTAESIIDRAAALTSIGGVYANQKPTEFLSLGLKLLVLQPERAILLEYLKAEEFKYLRALAAFYIRLTFRSIEVFEILEPLMMDFRKLRIREVGGYRLTYFDEFIDQLLTEERVCDVILPRMTKREVLEDTEGLPPRRSLLEETTEDQDAEDQARRKRRRLSKSPDRMSAASRSDVEDEGADHGDRYAGARGRRRSLSRTPSDAYASEGDGYKSRDGSVSTDRSGGDRGGDGRDREGRYVSRSPSVGSERSYKSRSRSMSLDRD